MHPKHDQVAKEWERLCKHHYSTIRTVKRWIEDVETLICGYAWAATE